MFLVSGKGLCFLNGIASIGNLLKEDLSFCIRPCSHYDLSVRADQRELHAGKRSSVLVMLQQQCPCEIVTNRCVAGDSAVLIHSERHHCFIQRIAARGQDFTEGVLSGNHGNIRDLAVPVSLCAVDHFSVRIRDFDQRTGDRVFSGDIRLGQRDRVPDQFIMHLFGGDMDLLIRSDISRLCLDVAGFRVQFPSIRSGKLTDIVPSVRIIPFKGQDAVSTGCSFCHQRICQQGATCKMNICIIEQAEGKTFAGSVHNDLSDRSVILLDLSDFLFLVQVDFAGNKVIPGSDGDLHQGRMIIRVFQFRFIADIREDISFRGRDFNQVIPAQGQLAGYILSVSSRSNGFYKFILCIPFRAVLADDVFCSMDFENCAFQTFLFINWLHDCIAEPVFFFLETSQLQSGLFQFDSAFYRFIFNREFQQIRFTGLIHVLVAHEDCQFFRLNQITFGSFELLNEIQSAPHGFRQHDRTVFICVEGINGLLTGIMNCLRYIFAICVLQFEGGIGYQDCFSCFGIHFDEFQAVTDSFIVHDQARGILRIFCSCDKNIKGRLDRISRFAFDLFYRIHAIRQQLGFRFSVLVSGDLVPFKLPGILIASGRLQVNLENSTFFRLLNDACVIVNLVITQELHKTVVSIQDLIGFDSHIGDDRFLRLFCGTGCVDAYMCVAGLIASRRRQFHQFIHTGPQFVCNHGSICSGSLQAFNDDFTFPVEDIALTVSDVFSGDDLEYRAGQYTVSTGSGSIFRIAGILILIPLVQPELYLHGQVCRGNVRDFI